MAITNKLWGLKQLQEITAGHEGLSTIPYPVYLSPKEFRLEHLMGMPRLLIRGDERGLTYNKLNWDQMSRKELVVDSISEPKGRIGRFFRKITKIDFKVKQIEKLLAEVQSQGNNFHLTQLIVHPTRLREDIAWTGRLVSKNFSKDKSKIVLDLKKNPSKSLKFHRGLFDDSSPFLGDLHHIEIARVDANGFKKLAAGKKEIMGIVSNAEKFISSLLKNKAVLDKLRLSGKLEASFVAYKDKPTHLEFYDLRNQA